MVIGREPDENSVLVMENKNEVFPLYISNGPLIPQDDSSTLVRVAATRSRDNSQIATKLSTE